MWPDGICRTTDRHYTKTVQFQDINYQLCKPDDKDTIFGGWAGFLNYFDSSIDFSLSFLNRSMSANGLEAGIFIENTGDDFDAVRDEYNGVLEAQLALGNNSIIKTKYLTFGLDAKSHKDAENKLKSIESAVLSNFKKLGVPAAPLSGKARLRLLHSIFHIGTSQPFRFNWKWLVPSGLSVKDFVSPSSFEFKTGNSFRMGDTFGQANFLQIDAAELDDRVLADLLDVESDILVTLHPSIRIGSDHRYARLDTLGPGYSAEELRAIIAGTKKAPQRKKPRQEKPINLLVDIQAQMQQGKGPGYERWAKSFNLKQMAETVLYLQEHDLLYYPDLAKKATVSSDRFRELSAEIKAAEQRMAELSILRTHIINYAKTRDTYVAYRKAGYSKKFLAEHESDILLHKAAKKYFDDAGLKKLPAVKEINSEYAELIAKKKTAYAEYRKSRDEMKELLIVKANVDRILGIEKDAEIEKDEPTSTRS